ncbi:MAG: 50S ribosomal protein L4 [Anaerolineae bacterium]
MQVVVRNMTGEKVEDFDLRDDIFGIEPNTSVMHQALVRQLANARQGTHKTKTRAEVKRTGAKWYRQKGTGRARHGSRRAPIFVGGGRAHGPQPRDYSQKMPRKMRRLALKSALSVKAAAEQVVLLDNIEFETPKTRNMVDVLENLNLDGRVVVLLPDSNENVEHSARNLPNVKTLRANYLNVRDLLNCDYLMMPKASVDIIEGILG